MYRKKSKTSTRQLFSMASDDLQHSVSGIIGLGTPLIETVYQQAASTKTKRETSILTKLQIRHAA